MGGRLKRIKDADLYVFVMEDKQDGRIVRHTSERLKEDEARTLLKQHGLSDSQIENEFRQAR